jgi:Lamin Tail Domain
MARFTFRTLFNDQTYGTGFFEYPDALGTGSGTTVYQNSVTAFAYIDPEMGSFDLSNLNNFQFTIAAIPTTCAFNIIMSTPDRLKSVTAGPAQPGLLGPTSGKPIKLEWPNQDDFTPAQKTNEPVSNPKIDAVVGKPAEFIPSVPVTTPALSPEPSQEKIAKVIISHIGYDGAVARVESDEYVEVTNTGDAAPDISGWKLHADDLHQDFIFPKDTLLIEGQKVRVYTNQVHAETGGFSYGSKRAIWNNQGDVARLSHSSGKEISRYGYGDKVGT